MVTTIDWPHESQLASLQAERSLVPASSRRMVSMVYAHVSLRATMAISSAARAKVHCIGGEPMTTAGQHLCTQNPAQ
eukprot:4407843-Amphidinium_carterae.1